MINDGSIDVFSDSGKGIWDGSIYNFSDYGNGVWSLIGVSSWNEN
jgi:hypothetical protein